MRLLSLSQLVPILQAAIGPVVLISGVGLLLLPEILGRLPNNTEDGCRARVVARGDVVDGDAGMPRVGVIIPHDSLARNIRPVALT